MIRIISLMIYSLLLVGCSAEHEYIVSEPISGGLSKSNYTIEDTGDTVTYRRNDEPSDGQ